MTLYFIFLHHLTKNNDKFLSSKLDAILEWVVVVLEESRGIVRIRTEQRKILISLGHSGVEFERGLSRVCDLHLTICEQRDWWCATVTNESTKFTYKAHLLLRASSPLRGNSKSKKKKHYSMLVMFDMAVMPNEWWSREMSTCCTRRTFRNTPKHRLSIEWLMLDWRIVLLLMNW